MIALALAAFAFAIAGAGVLPRQEGPRDRALLVPGTPGGEAAEHEGEGVKEREDWFTSQRAFPKKAIPEIAYQQAVLQAAHVRAASLGRGTQKSAGAATAAPAAASAAAHPLAWQQLGPSPISSLTYAQLDPSQYPWWNSETVDDGAPPYSGRVAAIATDPGDAQTVYVGAATGGVWKTVDGGLTWTPIFDDRASLSIGSIAVDPNAPNVVYVGTGEANLGGGMYPGAGIFKSTDGGASWQKIGGTRFDRCFVADLAVNPSDSKLLLAAVHGQASPGSTTTCAQGVYRSVDSGTSWTSVTGAAGRPADLAVDPSSSAVWYLGYSDGHTVSKSTNAGASWTDLHGGLPTTNVGRTALAVAPSDRNRLYAAVDNSSDDSLLGIWTSATAGETWSKLPDAPDLCGYLEGGELFGGQCSYDLTLAVSPTDPSVLFAGGVHLYKYVNGSYESIGRGLASNPNSLHVDFHALAYDAAGRLWVGNDGGVFRTSTDGATFQNLNRGLSTVQFYGLSGSIGGGLAGGLQDNGTVKYDGTAAWPEVIGADGGIAAVDPTRPSITFMTSQQLTIFRTLDSGATYEYAGPWCGGVSWYAEDCSPSEPTLFIAPIALAPRDPTTLFAGTMRLWKTANADSYLGKGQGLPWQPISPFFGDTSNPHGNRISAIAPAPSDPQTIYVGTSWGDVHVTTNGGGSWTKRNTAPLPATDCKPDQGAVSQFCRFVTDITVDDGNAAEAYLTISGFGSGHVFKTSNAGATWVDISGPAPATRLPDAPANEIVADTRTNPATLYVATDVGVFWSDDGGANWHNTSVGLPNTIVTGLVLDREADMLIAATHGRGAFAAPLGEASRSAGKILFTSDREGGDSDVFVMNPDGTGVVNLTANSPGADQDPQWSPDGQRIAFASNRDGNLELYTMSTGGGNVQRLTSDPADDDSPSWSPDGAELAFASSRGGNWDIYRMRTDGTGLARLTTNPLADLDPAWSSGGGEIAFVREEGPGSSVHDVWKLPAGGGGEVALAATPNVDERDPAWSPDGTRLALSRDGDLWTIGGGGGTAVTAGPAVDTGPTWSTDGASLAYSSNRDGNANLFTLQLGSGSPVRVTGHAAADGAPSWLPPFPPLVPVFVPPPPAQPVTTTPPSQPGSPPSNGTTNPTKTPKTPVCVVPQLRGKTLAAARSALRRAHCRLGGVRKAYTPRFRKGRVIAQSLRAGRRMRAGTRVSVVLSAGRRRV